MKVTLDSNQRETLPDFELDPSDINIAFLPLDGKDTLQRFKGKSASEELSDAARRTTSLFSNVSGDASVPNETSEKESKIQEPNTGTSTSDKISHTTKTAESTVIQKPGQSVNVEIHVTVNTSPSYGSGLADLKKQRCGQRNSITSSNSGQETNGKSVLTNGHFGGGSYDNAPSSPTSTPRKYHGDPLEVVGEQKKKRKCCVIM